MRAGQMRWPITIQQKVGTQNATTGEMTYTWTNLATNVFADMLPISRRGSKAAWEAVIAQQTMAQRVVQFDIRYMDGIDETMRIVDYNGGLWDIKTIINVDMRNRELWLICVEGVDVG